MSDNDDIKGFLEELDTDIGSTPRAPKKPSEALTEDNMERILLEKLGGIMGTLESSVETLAERLEAGDTFESTVMGIGTITGQLISGIKILDNRKGAKQKQAHEKAMKELSHEQRLIEIDKRNDGKPALGSGNTLVQNNFVGDREGFLKAIAAGNGAPVVVDVEPT